MFEAAVFVQKAEFENHFGNSYYLMNLIAHDYANVVIRRVNVNFD